MQETRIQIEQLFEQFLLDSEANPIASMPLVSPWTVKRIAEIMGVDIVNEPYQVPNMKTFLKTFLLQYRIEGLISQEEINTSLDMVKLTRERFTVPLAEFAVNEYSRNVQIYCVECSLTATRYCTYCKDSFCGECAYRVHAKASRKNHRINKILVCSLCRNFPARFQCTYSFEIYCVDCYKKKQAPTLPVSLDLKPLRIDYTLTSAPRRSTLPGVICNEEGGKEHKPSMNAFAAVDWHPFLDSLGVKYHYNFKTQESVRRLEVGKVAQKKFSMSAINKIKFDIAPKVFPDKLSKAQTEILQDSS